MGENKCGAGDITDFAKAGGDVLQGAPALREQSEAAFAQAAQRAQQHGAGVDSHEHGRSDPIDALVIARLALREAAGLPPGGCFG
ncbi:hypothetical protein SAMN05216276_10898 [Streptosporangium subroseum]|uniref:Uncharacterized protein n=2 Tax=Streptosporangium subroseum TaxID=106412 RepID=A0A239P6D7_9ACTN|nr:hypothetical protein SAMN05216276_10898 [Streptosporangium subroseum]